MRTNNTSGAAEGQLVIYPRRWKLLLFAMGALAFVLGAFWIGGFLGEVYTNPAVAAIATYAGIPFFGFCFVYLLYRLIVRKPALVVSEEGIQDNVSALSAGMIRWEEIKAVRTRWFGTQQMIVIALKDEQTFLSHQNPVKRVLMRANRSLIGYVVNIPQNILPVPADEVVREIKRYQRKGRGQRHSLPARGEG